MMPLILFAAAALSLYLSGAWMWWRPAKSSPAGGRRVPGADAVTSMDARKRLVSTAGQPPLGDLVRVPDWAATP